MIDADVKLGRNVRIFDPTLVNIFGCEIGDETFVGPFVEITRGVSIGRNCVIESHSFICTGVTIEDDVFVGHGVIFVNDQYPRIHRHVIYPPTLIRRGASLGSNSTIIGDSTIGEYAIIAAGAVVTKNVPALAIAMGNPARVTRQFKTYDEMFAYMKQRQPSA